MIFNNMLDIFIHCLPVDNNSLSLLILHFRFFLCLKAELVDGNRSRTGSLIMDFFTDSLDRSQLSYLYHELTSNLLQFRIIAKLRKVEYLKKWNFRHPAIRMFKIRMNQLLSIISLSLDMITI